MGDHNPKNKTCPLTALEALSNPEATCLPCTCKHWRNENDVGLLIGQKLLDAINVARKDGDYKGWTYKEMIHGPSVLPYTVYDEKDPDEAITEHVCIVSIGRATMTLMRTTSEGTFFQEFAAISKPKKV